MKTAIKSILTGLILIFAAGCSSNGIEGTWQYDGGVYNGKARKAHTVRASKIIFASSHDI